MLSRVKPPFCRVLGVSLAAIFACCALLRPVSAQPLGPATPDAPLSAATPARAAKDAASVYIVKLREAGAATYKGGTPGFAATKPSAGGSLDASSGAVRSYVNHLQASQDNVLAGIGAAGSKLHSFRYAMNGFSARLTAEQVSRLARRDEVERIWLDTDQSVTTINSAVFLGLQDPSGGLRADLGLRGEDVVVGFIDSGITPEHPSLLDVEERVPSLCRGRWARASWLGRWLCGSVRRDPPTTQLYEPPEGFRGVCSEGEGFPATACNNKVIGARYYVDGFLARHELDPNEFLSPKDADGHGTHIATVAAGNPTSARLFGRRVGRIAGIAPRARVAVYKACWLKPGDRRGTCATSDLVRAIDDAVADGVDIINYSVGSLETDLTAPDDIALLNALEAGVLTVVAAGNDGPFYESIGSPSSAPWVLTVGASTQNGTRFDEAIEITAPEGLEGRIVMREAVFTPRLDGTSAIEGAVVLVDDGQRSTGAGTAGSTRDGCQPPVNGDALAGSIALIERGGCDFQVKLTHAEQAGAAAAVVYNTTGEPIAMNGERGSVAIPAVMIGAADGQRLVDAIAGGVEVEARLIAGLFVEGSETGDRVVDFSSRGPALSEPDFLKPDVTAPGVNILGGQTPDAANALRGELFQYLSGTSMAAPEAAGVAALLKEARPDLSPSAIKSALMTSANRNVVRPGGETPADPFEAGAGRIAPNAAVDPGLVYDADVRDHEAFLCGLERPPLGDDECASLLEQGYSVAPRDLNLPSVGVSRLITGDTITRRVTNVGPAGTYRADIDPPPGIGVQVRPDTLTLASGESAAFELTFTGEGAPREEWAFGELTWSGDAHEAVSPLALLPVTLRAPEEAALVGGAGSFELPVAFGYGGEYSAGVHGLRAPYVEEGFVEEDEANSFSFRFEDGVSAHLIDVPPGQLFARFALFDAMTDGEDDLDLYLYHCPGGDCVQIDESGGFTSEEEIDVVLPEPGVYAVLVHGFETDRGAGGPGSHYSLFAWSVGIDDFVGNLDVAAPSSVADGERAALALQWRGLAPATRYLGAISHTTPGGLYALTILDIRSP